MAHWIKPGLNLDFVGQRKRVWWLSTVAIFLSVGALIANLFIPGRGSALNYGIDFKGGSQILVEFAREVDAGKVRDALTGAGFKGAEVVAVSGEAEQRHAYMLRLEEVSAFSPQERARAQSTAEASLKESLARFEYRDEESDRIYLHLKRGTLKTPNDVTDYQKRIVDAFNQAELAIQQVQLFGRMEDATYEVTLGGLANELRRVFAAEIGADAVKDIPSVESVGAKTGEQLRNDGIKAVIYALGLMLFYIAIRFDFRYAPGAVVALVHDLIITTGIFALFWIEFSLPTVAALLTIAGYSVNDTIVVFDRVRENVARLRDRSFQLVVNTSINETLSRTVLTSVTTLFTCVAIWVVATGVLKTFAIALTAGVLVGTYSSIFIASPLVILLNERFGGAKS